MSKRTGHRESIESRDWSDVPLMQAVPLMSPELREPWQVEELVALLEKAPKRLGKPGEGLRVCSSPPVRHGKTTTLIHAIVWWLLLHPKLEIAFMSHAAKFSQKWSRRARQLAAGCGLAFQEDFKTLEEWRTSAGGGVYWASCDQEVIGRGFDIIVVDDPIGPDDVWIPDRRDEVSETIEFLTTRLNTGGSVFLNMSRMAQDDPIGRRPNWHQVELQAIINENTPFERALCEELRSLKELQLLRAELTESGDRWAWDSQYQGKPPADQSGVFVGVVYFSGQIPANARRVIGLDVAVSINKRSDKFAAVVLAEVGNLFVIEEVVTHQRGTSEVAATIASLQAKYPGARLASYYSGQEKGILDLLYQFCGIPIEQMPARWGKVVRARRAAKYWCEGRMQVLAGQPWTRAFVSECHAFSGMNDPHDDQVDALTSACDALDTGGGEWLSSQFTFGRASF